MSVSVRYSRGAWVVDISTREGGKRHRRIESFGPGRLGKSTAEAFRDEIAPQAKAGKFWERQTATFRDLWRKFDAQLVVPTTRGLPRSPTTGP